MEKRTKKNKETLKEWLLSFEDKVGGGLVISLLVDEGNIEFISAVARNRYLGEPPKDQTEELDLDIHDRKKGLRHYAISSKDLKRYIG